MQALTRVADAVWPFAHDGWPEFRPAVLSTGKRYDAVRISEDHGEAALYLLRVLATPVGHVVADRDQWWFFIASGPTTDVPWPPMARYLGKGGAVLVPPPDYNIEGPRGLRWIHQANPRRRHPVTDASMLCTVLVRLHAATP